MRPIEISYRLMSEAIWTRILEHATPRLLDIGPELFQKLGSLDKLRHQAQYNTGSISTASQWLLYALAYYFAPKIVAEIGTFIGKSTMALAFGLDGVNSDSELHTCDANNAIELPRWTQSSIFQYQNYSSTQMLEELIGDSFEGRIEMLHFDGRLQQSDLELLIKLCSENAIFVLDDYEGTEKGVANAFTLRSIPRFKDYLTVYPPSSELLKRFGFRDKSTSALMYPSTLLRMTAQ